MEENKGILNVLTNIEKVDEKLENNSSQEEIKNLQRKKAKEVKKLKEYSNSMISRGEAYQMARDIASEEVKHLAEFYREPVMTSILYVTALTDYLIDKDIIKSKDEFQEYLDKVFKDMKEGAENNEREGEETKTKE